MAKSKLGGFAEEVAAELFAEGITNSGNDSNKKGKGSSGAFAALSKMIREKKKEEREQQKSAASLWRFIHGPLEREHPKAAKKLIRRSTDRTARRARRYKPYDEYEILAEDRMNKALCLFVEGCDEAQTTEILIDLSELSDRDFDAMVEAVLKEPVYAMAVKASASAQHMMNALLENLPEKETVLQWIRWADHEAASTTRRAGHAYRRKVVGLNQWLDSKGVK